MNNPKESKVQSAQAESTDKGGNLCLKDITQMQQSPESFTVALTSHARYIIPPRVHPQKKMPPRK